MENISIVKEPIKFSLVGISGIFINFIVLALCIYIFNFSEPISLAIGILFSISTNYYFNRIWTFQSQNPILNEYFKYIISNAIGSIIQYFSALLFNNIFINSNFTTINILIIELDTIFIASLFGIFFGFISNFLFSKFLVFRKKSLIN